jgi:hypothetical protein
MIERSWHLLKVEKVAFRKGVRGITYYARERKSTAQIKN